MTNEQIKKQADIYTDDSSNYTEWCEGWSDANDIELVKKHLLKVLNGQRKNLLNMLANGLKTR